MKPKRIGLIVNPKSGQGAVHNLATAQRLIEALAPEAVLTGPGQLGGHALPSAQVLAIPDVVGRAASQAVAAAALDASVDALAVIGGDGTLSDIAFTVYQSGGRCPILGVGGGSINAGDLIACLAAQVESLAGCDFRIEAVTALEASYNDQPMALAFNDVVIGTTIVGTVDGGFVDWDAAAFMAGQRIPGQPRAVGVESAQVTKRGPAGDVVVATGRSIGTVIAGFTHYEFFFGKAIVGGVCLSAVMGTPGGCLVCDQALVRTRLDEAEYRPMEPVQSSYVSLGEDDVIEITGLDAPAVLCADGNPLAALRPADRSQIRIHPGAVDVLRAIRRGEGTGR